MAGTSLHGLLDAAYDDYPRIEGAFQHLLDQSLDPRGPESLFALLETLALPSRGVAIDVGCGEGQDTLELNRRFGFRVLGIDPVARHIELATAAAAAAGVADSQLRGR
jgi:SAM-dependent methyltransferase